MVSTHYMCTMDKLTGKNIVAMTIPNTRQREAMKVTVTDECRPGLLKVGAVDFEMQFNGKVYTKQEALRHIAKTTKASDERGAMICFMFQ